MTNRRAAFVAILLLSPYAYAADQMILGKKFQIVAKDYDVEAIGKISMTAKELTSPNTIVGNPVANGGSLRVIVNSRPGGTQEQTFALSAAGWSALGATGFKYSNAQAGAAVVKVTIKKKAASGFFVTALLRRADVNGLLPISLERINLASGGIILTLGGGDNYCVGFGGPAGGGASFRPGGKRPARGGIGRTVLRMTNPTAEACPASSTRRPGAARPLRKGSGLVDAPGRGLVGAKGNSPF